MLVTNSGRLVPMATMVAPIMTLGTPTLVARYEPLSTIKYELATTPAEPKTAINMYFFNSFFSPSRGGPGMVVLVLDIR